MIEKNVLSTGHGENVTGVGESNTQWTLSVDAAEKSRGRLMSFIEDGSQTKETNTIDSVVFASKSETNTGGIDMQGGETFFRSMFNPFRFD